MAGDSFTPTIDQGKRVTQEDIAALIAERDSAPHAAVTAVAQGGADAKSDPMENFVLYTRAACRGSAVIKKMIDPVREDFRVVDVDTLDRSAPLFPRGWTGLRFWSMCAPPRGSYTVALTRRCSFKKSIHPSVVPPKHPAIPASRASWIACPKCCPGTSISLRPQAL